MHWLIGSFLSSLIFKLSKKLLFSSNCFFISINFLGSIKSLYSFISCNKSFLSASRISTKLLILKIFFSFGKASFLLSYSSFNKSTSFNFWSISLILSVNSFLSFVILFKKSSLFSNILSFLSIFSFSIITCSLNSSSLVLFINIQALKNLFKKALAASPYSSCNLLHISVFIFLLSSRLVILVSSL